MVHHSRFSCISEIYEMTSTPHTHTHTITVANYVIWHCVPVCGSYPSVKRRTYFITQMMEIFRIPQTMRVNIRCSHPYSKYNPYFNGGDYDDYYLLGSNAYSLIDVNQRFGKASFLQLQVQKTAFYARDECSTFVQNLSSYMPN